jgi:transcriptional regulator with GAF, ATPase, and Fis domain
VKRSEPPNDAFRRISICLSEQSLQLTAVSRLGQIRIEACGEARVADIRARVATEGDQAELRRRKRQLINNGGGTAHAPVCPELFRLSWDEARRDQAILSVLPVSFSRSYWQTSQFRSRFPGCTFAPMENRMISSGDMLVGESPALRRVRELADEVAVTDATVLLLGETGTGKELLATYIHEESARRARSMVRVNCAAVPDTLLESELFGRERGAFTGASERQVGRFELADRSTIFLDEIGDLPANAQVKLLRVLEERQIERLGNPKPIRVDTRIIAATHCDLETAVAEGKFREDLFYRLNVFPIRLPSLRERAEDIPLLVWKYVTEFSATFGKRIETITSDTMAALQRYPWPGNVRELRNVVERAMIKTRGGELPIELPRPVLSGQKRSERLVDVETEHLRQVLDITRWRIRGTNGAADRLGLRPTTLESRMAKLGLRRPTAAAV